MENLNVEQIIKALEHCTSGGNCSDCLMDDKYPRYSKTGCMSKQMYDALALIKSQEQRIKEITEENERLRSLYGKDGLEIADYAVDKIRATKSDTAKKMHSEIKRRCIEGGIYPAFVASVVEQVVKEITDEAGE